MTDKVINDKSQSPYEIRTNLLYLAREILISRNDRKCDPSSAPTTEEIISEAEKLNRFVSGMPKKK